MNEQECITCEIFTDFHDQMLEYAQNIFLGFGNPLGDFLMKLTCVWLLWTLAIHTASLDREPIKTGAFLRHLLVLSISISFLRGNGELWFNLLMLPLELALDISIALYRLASGEDVTGEGFSGLIYTIEVVAIKSFRDTIDSILQSIGWKNFYLIFYVILFAVAFFYMAWEMIKQITVSLVKYMLIVILFPFILGLGLFPLTRRIFFNAIRIFVVSSFEIMSTVTLSTLAIFMNNKIIDISPYENVEAEISQAAFLNSSDYWKVVITMGIIGLVYRQAIEVINQIMEVSADATFRKNFSPSSIKNYVVDAGRTVGNSYQAIRSKYLN